LIPTEIECRAFGLRPVRRRAGGSDHSRRGQEAGGRESQAQENRRPWLPSTRNWKFSSPTV